MLRNLKMLIWLAWMVNDGQDDPVCPSSFRLEFSLNPWLFWRWKWLHLMASYPSFGLLNSFTELFSSCFGKENDNNARRTNGQSGERVNDLLFNILENSTELIQKIGTTFLPKMSTSHIIAKEAEKGKKRCLSWVDCVVLLPFDQNSVRFDHDQSWTYR